MCKRLGFNVGLRRGAHLALLEREIADKDVLEFVLWIDQPSRDFGW